MWETFLSGVVTGVLLLLFTQKIVIPYLITVRKSIKKNKRKIYRFLWILVAIVIVVIPAFIFIRDTYFSIEAP